MGNTGKANISAWTQVTTIVLVGDKQETTSLMSFLTGKFQVIYSQRGRLPRKAGRGELVIELVESTDSRFHEGVLTPGWYQLRGLLPRHAFVVVQQSTDEQLEKFAEALRLEFFLSREEKDAMQRAGVEELLGSMPWEILRARLASFVHIDDAPLHTD